MSRAVKLLLYIFIALVFIIGVFHDILLAQLFKQLVQEKSKGKIELIVESFHFGLLYSTISFDEPVIVFEELYLDKSKGVKIEKITFNEVKIEGLSIFSLVFKKDIVADRVLVDKPGFWLVENGRESKSDVQPKGFVKALKLNGHQFSDFKASIKDVDIHYGSINLSQNTVSGFNPGQVDFSINLKGFSTFHDTTKSNLTFYSDEFRFEIRNLHRSLNSGYNLDIDSVFFSSLNRDVTFRGISFSPSNIRDNQNSIGFSSRLVTMNNVGIEDLSELHELHLRSVVLSQGTFINYNNVTTKRSKKNNNISKLKQVLNGLVIDTISLNRFNYYNIAGRRDTVVSSNDINFRMTDVELDSSMYADIIERVGFEDISIKTGPFALKDASLDLFVNYDQLSYSNDDTQFELKGVKLKNSSVTIGKPNVDFSIPELRLNGLSIHKLQNHQKQYVSLNIFNPEGTITLPEPVRSADSEVDKFALPIAFYLYELNIENGGFNIIKKNQGTATVKGLDFFVAGLHIPESGDDSLYFEDMRVSSDEISAILGKEKATIRIGDLSYQSGSLLLNSLMIQQTLEAERNSINIQTLGLSGFDEKLLLSNSGLYFDTLRLNRPVVNAKIGTNKDRNVNSDYAFDELVSPLKIHVSNILLEDGKVNSTFKLNGESAMLKAGFNTSIGAIDIKKGDTLKSVLQSVRWKIDADNLIANSFSHKLQISSLSADSYGSEFLAKQIFISPKEDIETDLINFHIRSFSLPSFEVRGLDYNLLIWNDSVNCSAIKISNPQFDMTFAGKSDDATKGKKDKLINFDEIPQFGYDTIEVAGLHFNFERRGEGIDEFVNVKELDFSHYRLNSRKRSNLISNLVFNLNEFNYYNSLTSNSFTVKRSYLNSSNNTFYVEGVSRFNIDKDGSIESGKKSMGFNLDSLELTGITVEQALPTRITARKLKINDFDLDLVTMNSIDDSPQKFNIDPDIMKRVDNVISLIQLDTALVDDVSFKIKTIDGEKTSALNVDSIGVLIEKIKLDTALANMSRPTIIDQVTVDLRGKTRISKDSLYEIHSGKLHYNFPNQIIVVDSFYVTPLYEPKEFFSRYGYQTDRVDLFVPKVEIDGIDLNELVTKNHLQIRHVNLYDVEAEMYRDKHYPFMPGIYKQLPRKQIMSIKRAVTIDSIRVFDSYLKYKELSEKADEPGELFISNISASVLNFTNRLKEGVDRDLSILFNGKVMGRSSMDMNIQFPLNPDSVSFRLVGKTDNMELSMLNPLTTNLLGIGIIKGVGSVDVKYIEGSSSSAQGSLIFRYKNLRLLPYSRNKERLRSGALSPLLSFMINDLVVKSNNPKFARKPRVGQVYFERDTRKGVINFIWKGVLSGITSTMGFSNKEQRKVKSKK